MMKKTYVSLSVTAELMGAEELICDSQDITSNVGIDYGGVDEEGTKTVDSRRHSVWDEE